MSPAVQLLIAIVAGSLAPPAAGASIPISQVQEICGGNPSFSEIRQRGTSLGWLVDAELAARFKQGLSEASPPEDQPIGEALALTSGSSPFIFVLNDEWTGCVFRDPSAEALPTSVGWNEIFGLEGAELNEVISADGVSLLSFTDTGGAKPSYATLVENDAVGVTDQTVGLTIVYEYSKEAN